MDKPRLVLAVGPRMIDIMDADPLMEWVYWDDELERWENDTGDIGKRLADGLNRLGYRPEEDPRGSL